MFSNMIIYRVAPTWSASLDQVESALSNARYVACSPSQEKSTGWVEPRGESHGALIESIGGHWILKFMSETKDVPGAVVDRQAKIAAQEIAQEVGRKPGRKELKEIKEGIRFNLLPMAFPKLGASLVWIDCQAHLLVIDAASQAHADEVVTALVKSLEGFAVALLDTRVSPVSAMAEWLTTQEPPAGFAIEQECELKAADESKAAIRYTRSPLDTDEVKQHIAQGMLPSRLALSWDDRASFLLTENMQLKKVHLLDVVFEGKSTDDGGFDADVAIATGEFAKLLPDLIQALGGVALPPEASAAAAGGQ